MSENPTWFSWFTFPFYAPLSGAVSQDISSRLYEGVPEIEAAVIQEVASYGRQLGILSEAVLEIARKLEPAPPREAHTTGLIATAPDEEEPAVAKLRGIVDEIEEIKCRHREAVMRDAERALARLQKVDPAEAEKLAARFRS